MAYIEDDHMRFNVLAGQPSGVASLKSGKSIHYDNITDSSILFLNYF